MLPPLADRLRPTTLQQLIGQTHITGTDSVLQKCIVQGMLPSMILWGPPGVGKTTIANIIAHTLQLPFYNLSAINSGVKDIREVIELAKTQKGSILFIDEIHRFNKGQQDALLNAVEKGTITLIGATTENPSFEVNSALLSRCQTFILKHLDTNELKQVIENALKNDEILKTKNIKINSYQALIQISGGDARKLLNLLELIVNSINKKEIVITDEIVINTAQQNIALYDKNGEQHYDIISAFIKSMRGSDPNAAIYWLARMIKAGEAVTFIARRMIIFSAEDIGIANPNALLLANACFDAVNKIGYPEARIILAECAIYLATSVKSNASYMAIENALQLINETADLSVPLHLRNAPTKLMKDLDYGKDYQYDHNFSNNFSKQEFLPATIQHTIFYNPSNNPKENEIRNELKKMWKNKYLY